MNNSITSRIMRLPEVKTMTGLSRSTIYSHIGAGIFPRPVNLGVRSVGWLESDIESWLEDRIQKSRQPSKSVHMYTSEEK